MRSRPPTSQRTRSVHGGVARCAPPGRARPPNRGTSERNEPPQRDYPKALPPPHEKVARPRGQVESPPRGDAGASVVGHRGPVDELARCPTREGAEWSGPLRSWP